MGAVAERPPARPGVAQAALGDALAAEREGRWADSFVLCRQALADPDQHPDAFNLLGRLSWQAGDAATAIASQRYALVLAPDHPRAAGDLRVALAAVRSTADAASAFGRAVAQHPDVTCHHRGPMSLRPFAGMDDVERALQSVLALDPSFAPAHAALGNVRVRQGRRIDAFNAYSLAAMLDWNSPDVHLALAAFFDVVFDEANASRHRDEALSRKQVYAAANSGAACRVLVLTAPGGPTANAPLDYCVDHARVALHVCYLSEDAPPPELPAYDLVFNAIEEAESSQLAIERAARFIASQTKPAINRPQHLAKVRRSVLPATLRDIPGCSVPPTRRVARDNLEREADAAARIELAFPLIVRPVDTHRGDGQEHLANAAELRDYLGRVAGTHFNVSPFAEYRSADGYYRKYRVVVIDGEPFPYHLAISQTWKVHYHSSAMEQHAWMRAEEERFFHDPRAVFPTWDVTFAAIAKAVGLDYFGIDCAVGPDGCVLVFECGPGMLVHCFDDPQLYGYKYDHVPKIFAALEDLLDRVAGRDR